MNSIVIVGSGNLATHFHKAFLKHPNAKVIAVYNRKNENLYPIDSSIKVVEDPYKLPKASLYIIAVKDDAIAQIVSEINNPRQLMIHCSGSCNLDILGKRQRKGVLYPLQSFKKNQNVNWINVPLLIEAEQEQDLQLLKTLSGAISSKVHEVDSKKRIALHLSAIFVNNFTNHLLSLTHQLSEEFDFNTKVLEELILKTKEEFKTPITSMNSQTGPAIRNDQSTLENHLNFIKEQIKDTKQQENFIEVYKTLSKSIQTYHHNNPIDGK